MRLTLILILAALPLAGCASFAQGVYDEQAEAECYEIPNAEAQRACLNELEDRRWRRD
ncbi:MAG: hypothetical protein ACFE0P_05920 [Oceanicaulis sp.]